MYGVSFIAEGGWWCGIASARLQLVYKYLGWGWGRYQTRRNCYQLVATKDNHQCILINTPACIHGSPCACEIGSSAPVTSNPRWILWSDWSLLKWSPQKHHCGSHIQWQGSTTPRALNGSWRMSPQAQLHSSSHTGSGLGRQSQQALLHQRTILLPLTIHLLDVWEALHWKKKPLKDTVVCFQEEKRYSCASHSPSCQVHGCFMLWRTYQLFWFPVCSHSTHQQIRNNVRLCFVLFLNLLLVQLKRPSLNYYFIAAVILFCF